MTLNELISKAKENGVDFDKQILCQNEDEMGYDTSLAVFCFSDGSVIVANENYADSSFDEDFGNCPDNLKNLVEEFKENDIPLDEDGFSGWLGELVFEMDFETIEEARERIDAIKQLEKKIGVEERKYAILQLRSDDEYFVDTDDNTSEYDLDEYNIIEKAI